MRIKANTKAVELIETDQLNTGEYNVEQMYVELSSEYTTTNNFVVYKYADIEGEHKYKSLIFDGSAEIPSFNNVETVKIGVYGFEYENGELKLRYSPTMIEVDLVEGTYETGIDDYSTEEGTDFERYVQEIEDLVDSINNKQISTITVDNQGRIKITYTDGTYTQSDRYMANYEKTGFVKPSKYFSGSALLPHFDMNSAYTAIGRRDSARETPDGANPGSHSSIVRLQDIDYLVIWCLIDNWAYNDTQPIDIEDKAKIASLLGYMLSSDVSTALAGKQDVNITIGNVTHTVAEWLGLKQDVLTFDNSPTSGSNNPVKSGGIYSAIADVMEVAEGKTATFTLSYATSGNSAFNSQSDYITVNGFTDMEGEDIDYTQVKVGDIVLVTETDVPDRWVQSIDETEGIFTLYKMETAKVDLTNYALKSYVDNAVATKQDINVTIDNITKTVTQWLTALNSEVNGIGEVITDIEEVVG